MARPLPPPGETPPAEGSTSGAHRERPDGGVWEHPGAWLALVTLGCLMVAGFFLLRLLSL
ncbi:DUF6480 family protein [Streptomyces sp. MS06]|uniref:DUF6480 family protein n=1 Tax=Streptomyces sp. MS06 TaxID=3385974 RepID=UPI0039A3F09A